MQRLLRALFHADPSPYGRALVRPERPVPFAGVQPAVALLSARELVVLRYLPSRLTNAEIAEEMYVSLNTVKTYVKSIYNKLGVSTRREAIERAEELGLV
jgi:LuxR family maltose regulon positive regulatory protein